jgi:hypothetical protein
VSRYHPLPGSLTSRGFTGSGFQAAMARAFPRRSDVGHAREQAAQLDSGRELATLLEDDADRGGLGLGDDEHASRMGAHTGCGKVVEAMQGMGRRLSSRILADAARPSASASLSRCARLACSSCIHSRLARRRDLR